MPISNIGKECLAEVESILVDLQSYSDEEPQEWVSGSPRLKVTGNWIAAAYTALIVSSEAKPGFREEIEGVFRPITVRRRPLGKRVRTTRDEIRQVDGLIEKGLKNIRETRH